MPLSQELLELVACPICRGPLTPSQDCLICTACRVSFPVREGIAVLLADQAKPLGADRDR